MTIRHLRVFSAVCACQSVTKAAKKLYISQPAASGAIAELEAHYGVRLFDRIGRRLCLTQAGERFLSYTNRILGLFDELEHTVELEGKGILRVGASITVGTRLLPGIVRDFRQSHPAIAVEATVENSEAIEDRVLHNEIDLGLIEGAVHLPQIRGVVFYRDRMALILPPDFPEDGQELPVSILGEYPLLLREKGSAGREIVDGILSVHGIAAKPAWQSISTQAIVQAVRSGLGISLLPYPLVRDAVERGEVRAARLQGVDLQRSYRLLVHREKFLSPAIRAFADACRRLDAPESGVSLAKEQAPE